MFIRIIAEVPVANPPPVGAILWARHHKIGYTTDFHGTEYVFWSREAEVVSELELQQAVAEITHYMLAIHASMFDVVNDFQDHTGPTWETYANAIQAGKSVADALTEALIIPEDGEDKRFDAVFYLVPKKGE